MHPETLSNNSNPSPFEVPASQYITVCHQKVIIKHKITNYICLYPFTTTSIHTQNNCQQQHHSPHSSPQTIDIMAKKNHKVSWLGC